MAKQTAMHANGRTGCAIDDLITQMEAATEGSRELDCRIAYALGWRFNGCSEDGVEGRIGDDDWPDLDNIGGHWHKPGDRWAESHEDPGLPRWDDPPEWTTSLDAAMTLVPEGWRVYAIQQHHHGDLRWYAGIDQVYGQGIGRTDGPVNGGPALALCIASLKARDADITVVG